MPEIEPFSIVLPQEVRDQFADAMTWLRSLPFGGDEAATRLSVALDRELPALCADLAERFASGSNLPRPDHDASLVFARPAYKHLITTAPGGRRRRQSAGVWAIFYDLPAPATVRLLALHHSAAQPLAAWLDPAGDSPPD